MLKKISGLLGSNCEVLSGETVFHRMGPLFHKPNAPTLTKHPVFWEEENGSSGAKVVSHREVHPI